MIAFPNFVMCFSAVTEVWYYGWVHSKCQVQQRDGFCYFNRVSEALGGGVVLLRHLMPRSKVFGGIFHKNLFFQRSGQQAHCHPAPRVSVGVKADYPEMLPFCVFPSQNCSVTSPNLPPPFPPFSGHHSLNSKADSSGV